MPPKTSTPPSDPSQTLPPKQQTQFKQVVKLYESKHYKKANKVADSILKTHPNHGETLSMKGLTLSVLNKKEEAYQLVKRGLTESKFKSHVCWHVYGLLHRADRNYKEAIKCYNNALKIDKNNLQVLRDLAQLQVQCMETNGLLITRHKLLELKPGHKFNWVGFAVAQHLAKNYSTALQVLHNFETLLDPADTKYEKSEFVMYRNMIMFESGDFNKTLEHLEAIKDVSVDKVGMLETKAKCYRGLDKPSDAHAVYFELIQSYNCEHRGYIMDYVNTAEAMQGKQPLTSWTEPQSKEVCEVVYKILEDLEQKVPASHVVRRLVLDVAVGDAFKTRTTAFVQRYLKKTIPALFSALKSLYNTPEKIEIMEKLFVSWEESLRTKQCFPETPDETELPQTGLWATMLVSAHFYRKAEYETALTWIEKAIAHTPTVEMLYILQARILKHMNKLQEASDAVEKARLLDTADRYLNTKAVKYHLRNNKIKEADRLTATFARAPEEPPLNNVVEMQCTWYEIEEGDAYYRLGDIITAMKKWLLVDKHFGDISEDQMDFHQYCLRKLTLRAYIETLRWDKKTHHYPVYLKAAKKVVQGFTEIYDQQQQGVDLQSKVLHLFKETEEEKAAKEAEEKEKEKAGAKKKQQPKRKGKPQKNKKRQDDDDDDDDEDEEDPSALAKEYDLKVDLQTPLDSAVRFAESLQQYAPEDVEAHAVCFKLYLRRKKPLLVLRHLLQVIKLNKDYKDLPQMREQFKAMDLSDAPAAVQQVIKETPIA